MEINQEVTRTESSVLASFADYVEAQRLVDRMSDDGFPVESVRIIGDGVRTVEQVTGRMTRGRAAAAGAASGAWFGVFIGLLFGLFTAGAGWLWFLLISLLIGAFWGAVFGFVAHWSTRGRRDFSSVMTLEAQRYEVHVDRAMAGQAARYVL
ncbi:general stress protein [Lentzea sp. E54]|uniref:general stress protein n=1 Tax=Lentzea xerophila TaxID=3435883 RepID=UPI003DA204A4